jgi:hypothetical protein
MIREPMDGLRRLLTFTNHLKARKIHFDLAQDRPDSVMVTLTLLGARIEVDFFEDHFEYSVFTGNENVEDDERKLLAMINDFARD